jgi:hypothetical protein
MKKTKTHRKNTKPSTSTVVTALETRSCTIGLDLGDAQHAG